MNRICSFGFSLLAALFLVAPLGSQETAGNSTSFDDLSAARLNRIAESRRLAQAELAAQSAAFETPDIARALDFPFYLIAVARITAVEPANGSSVPNTRTSFHVEQMLRGKPDVIDFVVQSRWKPASLENSSTTFFSEGNPYRTVLDRTEPKIGDRYILGYTLDYGGDGKTALTANAINLQDPAQTQLIEDVKQFLTLESAAANSGFEPFLAAMDSSIPWFRDIAVYRLTDSKACNAAPDCTGKFSAIVRRQLQSKVPNERMQAIHWITWIDSVSRTDSRHKKWLDGVPILPDSAIRQLLNAAVEDPNVYIGDKAFELSEMSAFSRTGQPGECIEVVPALRRSARRVSTEPNPLPVSFPFTYTTSCLPSRALPGR